MSKNHFIYETIFFVLIIIGLSFQIYLTVIFDQINLSSIQSLVDNWKNGPITHLFSSKENSCPPENNFLENESWKGTVSGGRNYLGQIIRMPNNSTGFGVNAIKSIPEQQITHWKGRLLCGARMDVQSYFDLNIISPDLNEVCPPYYSICNGIIDSLGNRLCVSNNDFCPINFIKHEKYINNQLNHLVDDYVWYDDDFYYFIKNSNEHKEDIIIKDFLFSEGTPCFDHSYANMTEDPYILDYYYEKNKCPFELNQSVFFKLDSYLKIQFYAENNITSKLQSLPSYTFISDTVKMGIYYRGYPGINKTCFEDIEKREIPSMLIKLKKDLNKCFNWSTINVLVDTVAFILLLTSYSAEITHVLIQKDKKPPYTKPVLMIATIFSVIFSCVLFANITAFPNNLIAIFEKKQCVDENVFTLMSPLINQLYQIKIFIWIILGEKILFTLRYGMMPAIKYAT